MRYLWVAGLIIAVCSATALIVLPVPTFFIPGFAGLIIGLAVAAAGAFVRLRQQKLEIRMAMKSFAERNGGAFQTNLPVDQLPSSISLFQRGRRQRCTNVITLCSGSQRSLLFLFEYYHPNPGRGIGAWIDYYVAFVPDRFPDCPDVRIPGSTQAQQKAVLNDHVLQSFAEHPDLCLELVQGNLAVWHNRSLTRLWRTGIDRYVPFTNGSPKSSGTF